ncbi:MAG TPA: PP2C family protein-serine/threonine phosphatase [Thermoanaerobaculia bacterium]|nr:PP2C family protein-serine/threonine phosphatase [Thermoanaerobaculia bacterium]
MGTRDRRRARPGTFERLDTFLREYTAGLSTREIQRLFERDAANAYAVLTREHALEPEPERGLRRLLFRAKIIFLGLSYKLTPPRRLLFALSLLTALAGILNFQVKTTLHGRALSLEFSPLWFLVSIFSLLFILSLELVDRIRVRDELEVARELQAEFLPRRVPDLPGFRFAHSYRTANEVGGDYYDFATLPDGRLALMVGDASGHGMAAALVMAIANASWKTALDLDPAPERVLALLNRALCRTRGKRTFMTVFYALLDPATGRLEYISAGHPFPLLRRGDGRVEELGEGGLPLGIREPLTYRPGETVLDPGDLLVLYTDGLVEATDPGNVEAFGYERLQRLVAGGGEPQILHDRILNHFDAHVGGEPLRDDLTLMIVARFAAPPAEG